MKHGANFKDRNDIARLANQGMEAGEIAAKLQIKRSCVEAFMPGAEKKQAAKSEGKTTGKTTAKKPAAKAVESTENTGE